MERSKLVAKNIFYLYVYYYLRKKHLQSTYIYTVSYLIMTKYTFWENKSVFNIISNTTNAQ